MSHVTEFAQSWIAENINAEPYDPGSAIIAAYVKQLTAEAQDEGISAQELADEIGDLEDYISEALEAATDNEVDRLVSKDD